MKKRTFEELHSRALKYETRGDFQKGDSAAYQDAKKRGKDFLDKICSHMKKSHQTPHTIEEITAAIATFDSRGEFQKKNPTLYRAANRRDDFEELCKDLKQYKDRSGENNSRFKWSIEKITIEVKKYKTRTDFQDGSPGAYGAARSMNILENVCFHMGPSLMRTYTLKELQLAANNYTCRIDFQKGNSKEYSFAFRHNLLEKVCSHMKRPSISKPEKAILDAVQSIYPTAKKFLATKLNFPGKEYIKKLEVDICVKELGKAIEYDSRRFHSIEGLTRGHPTWPKEDIPQYHGIKDAVFAALGIEILHITQDEWEADQEACIKKCLNFLSDIPCP